MKNEDENKNLIKLLLLLNKNLNEQFNILDHDVQHLKFITTSLKNFSGLSPGPSENNSGSFFENLDESMEIIQNRVKDAKEKYFSAYRAEKWQSFLNSKPNNVKKFIFNFNRDRIRYVRVLSTLSQNLDYMHKSIAEVSYSLPPVVEPIRRYKRKIDRDDLEVLKNIVTSYKKRLSNLLNKENKEEINKRETNPVLLVDYSVSTKLSNRFVENIDEIIGESGNKNDELEFVMLPYWAVKITEYVSASAHEIAHLYLKKNGNLNQEIKILIQKIIKKFKEILDDYSIYSLLSDEDMPENNLVKAFVEEIIADLLSILISGPSYYFTLFSQGTARYPLVENIISGSILMYARIYTLYYTIKGVIEQEKQHKYKIIPEYWAEMFEASKKYMDALTDEKTITEEMYLFRVDHNNIESINALSYKLSIQNDIGKEIAKIILEHYKIGKNNSLIINSDEIDKNVNSIKEILKVMKNKDIKNLKFILPQIFSNCIVKNNTEKKEIFRPENIPEYLWDISLFYFYNTDINKKTQEMYEKIQKDRLPKLQVARLLGTKARFDLFVLNHDKFALELEEPEEWLFARMDWMQIKCEVPLKEETQKSCVSVVTEKFKKWWKIENKKYSEKEFKVNFMLGDYDFIMSLKGASTRKENKWPPMIIEAEEEKNKNYIAPYTYREYIVEKIKISKESEKYSNNKKQNPEKVWAYILKFIKFANIDNANKEMILTFIKDQYEKYEIYLSNSWNTLFLKKPITFSELSNDGEIAEKLDDIAKQNYKLFFEDIQTFLVFPDDHEQGKNNSNRIKGSNQNKQKGASLITLIKTRGDSTNLAKDNNFLKGIKKHIYPVSGITDYVVKWQYTPIENLYEYFTKNLIDALIKNSPENSKDKTKNYYFSTLTMLELEKEKEK